MLMLRVLFPLFVRQHVLARSVTSSVLSVWGVQAYTEFETHLRTLGSFANLSVLIKGGCRCISTARNMESLKLKLKIK